MLLTVTWLVLVLAAAMAAAKDDKDPPAITMSQLTTLSASDVEKVTADKSPSEKLLQ